MLHFYHLSYLLPPLFFLIHSRFLPHFTIHFLTPSLHSPSPSPSPPFTPSHLTYYSSHHLLSILTFLLMFVPSSSHPFTPSQCSLFSAPLTRQTFPPLSCLLLIVSFLTSTYSLPFLFTSSLMPSHISSFLFPYVLLPTSRRNSSYPFLPPFSTRNSLHFSTRNSRPSLLPFSSHLLFTPLPSLHLIIFPHLYPFILLSIFLLYIFSLLHLSRLHYISSPRPLPLSSLHSLLFLLHLPVILFQYHLPYPFPALFLIPLRPSHVTTHFFTPSQLSPFPLHPLINPSIHATLYSRC